MSWQLGSGILRYTAMLPRLFWYETFVLMKMEQLADKVWWASRPVQSLRPFEMGHSGFEVGAYVQFPLKQPQAVQEREHLQCMAPH